MKKFFRRLGKTRLILLCFIPFGVWGYCSHGWLGVLAAIIGWGVGWQLGKILYNRNDSKRRLKRFLQRRTDLQLKLLVKGTICIPVMIACVRYAGWLGLIGSLAGIFVGELICRRWLK